MRPRALGCCVCAVQVMVWNLKSGIRVHDLQRRAADATSANAHDGAVESLCSVGEGMVASGGSDGAVRVWSTKDGQLLHELDQVQSAVLQLCVGQGFLFSLSRDGAVATPLYSGCLRPLRFHVRASISLDKLNDSVGKFMALRKPVFEFAQRTAVSVVTALQIASFCVTPVTAPHLPPELQGAFSVAKDLGFTRISMSVPFELVYYTTVGAAVLFIVTMLLVQERLETASFLRPEAMIKYCWLGAKLTVELSSTLLFVSIFRTLLRGLDCTYVDTGDGRQVFSMDAVAGVSNVSTEGGSSSGSLSDTISAVVVGLECWSLEHTLAYALPSSVCLVAHVCLSVRLLWAGSDLSALEVEATRPFDWSGDSRKPQPRVHPLSFRSPYFGVATVLSKAVVATAEVLFTHYALLYATALLATTVAMLLVTWTHRPYHSDTSNRVQLAVQLAVVSCAGAQLIATVHACLGPRDDVVGVDGDRPEACG